MGGQELDFINHAFNENWIAPLGPNVDGFELDLVNYSGVSHAAALSSGTAAIHLALILSGVEAGDTVIASSFTFSATINPIVYQKAEPILIDSEEDTWNMDPALLEEAIQDGIKKNKKPKAVIFVHLYGMPGKIEEVAAICKRYEIILIEDAAEALGSYWDDKALGSFGDFGVYSFNGNKIITTSGGGALVANIEKHVKKARFLATQARDTAPHYQHSEIGYNYRMSNIAAGIGRGQMLVLDEWVKRRRANFDFYKNALSAYGFEFLEDRIGAFSNRWLTTALIDKSANFDTNILREGLELHNIETRPLWKPMHLQPIFAECRAYTNGVSEKLFDKGICLPSSSSLSETQKNYVLSQILKIAKGNV
jgi:dTDP-4-amino-4,6-dideoxygalactose transaminase